MAPAALIEMALAALGLVEIDSAVSLSQRDGALDAGQFARATLAVANNDTTIKCRDFMASSSVALCGNAESYLTFAIVVTVI